MSIYSATFFSGSQGLNKPLRVLLILLAVFFVHACGFQLRGALDLSQDIAPIYIQQNSVVELAQEIRSLLTRNKIATAKKAGTSNSQITLSGEAKERRVLSVDANGRAREYLLTYRVNFAIKLKQSEEMNDSITLNRSLLFEPEAVLAVTNESEILYGDMRRDAARSILLKLQAKSRDIASSTPSGTDKTESETPAKTQ